MRAFRIIVFFFAASTLSCGVAGTVYSNGRIYTANRSAPWASAMVERDKRIVYVGDEAGAARFSGWRSPERDLGGKLVIPGMVDAHTHPGMVAQTIDNIAIADAHSRDELIRAIRDMVAANPDPAVLIGGFWNNELFGLEGPHRSELDRIESDRPVILYDYWAHSIWANSKALEMAGVDEETADLVPDFAYYQRDSDGQATGYITESAASVFVNHFEPMTEQVEQALSDFLFYLRDLGVLSLMDAGNFGLDDQIYEVLSRWDQAGKLPLRYHGSYTLFKPQDAESAVETLRKMDRQYSGDRLQIDTLKIFLDGIVPNRTAYMSFDYLDSPGRSGRALLSREQLHRLVLELDAAGYNLHVHVVGNRAASTMLDAVQDAHGSLGRAPGIRIALCHLEVVDDSDFRRFRKFGVIANFTPHWLGWGADELSLTAIGDRAWSVQRAQPIISDGGVVNFSSDITDASEWKSDRANPFLGMQVAHNRQDVVDGPNAPVATPISERLQRDDLVDGYTRNGAYQLGRQSELGSIEVGKSADFVVLNQNLFEVDPYEIHETRPIVIIMEGERVFGQWPAEQGDE